MDSLVKPEGKLWLCSINTVVSRYKNKSRGTKPSKASLKVSELR